MLPSDFPVEPVVRVRPSEAELAARRSRNRALGFLLVALAGLFYVMTLAKLGLRLPFFGG